MQKVTEAIAFIEEAGLTFESFGMPRMAGRIIGCLVVSDKGMVSFDEFVRVLQASKSSISTNARTLVNARLIKPVSMSGDRKTWYVLSPDISLKEILSREHELTIGMNNLFVKGLKIRSNPTDETSLWVKEIIDFTYWYINKFPEILTEWEEHKKSTAMLNSEERV